MDPKNKKTRVLSIRITEDLYNYLCIAAVKKSVVLKKPYSLSKMVLDFLKKGIKQGR